MTVRSAKGEGSDCGKRHSNDILAKKQAGPPSLARSTLPLSCCSHRRGLDAACFDSNPVGTSGDRVTCQCCHLLGMEVPGSVGVVGAMDVGDAANPFRG